ncbi:MAG: hypothetical protein Q7J32_19180 [Sphingomonadaceae bacterium]|nr:hypothetical protein [Sphingomonadaceae bacterium]
MSMMTAVALIALVAGHWGFPPLPPPEAYARPADQELARRGQSPCLILGEEDGVIIERRLPTDQCYKMLPPQRMRGVWIDEFEGSRFYPDRTAAPRGDEDRPMIWLDVGRVELPHGYTRGRPDGRAVLVDFIGRRTRYRAPSGHMGLFDYEIIVDRVISAKELSNP